MDSNIGACAPGMGSSLQAALPRAPLDWLEQLQILAARFHGYGIGPDLTALSIADLWGLYRFLVRLAAGASA